MPAPTNISAATATELGPLPNSIAQQVDDAGTTYTVWYKYTALGTEKEIGVWALGDLAVYKPKTDCFSPDGVTDWPTGSGLGSFGGENKRVQIPISTTPGQVYYFKITTNAGNPSPANLTISGLIAPDEAITDGDILVNDDTENFPAAILDPTTGDVKAFVQPMPAGEGGAILPSGIFALTGEESDNEIHIFDVDLTERATIALSTFQLGASNTYFYAAVSTTVTRFDVDGTAIDTWTLPFAASRIQPSRDDTILYWTPSAGGEANVKIKRWDLVNDIALSDLYSYPANTQLVGDILVLSDETVLIGSWHSVAVVVWAVLHLSAAGATLNTYDLTADKTLNHLALATNDLTSFWAWSYPGASSLGTSRYQEIQVSDGTVLNTFDTTQYEIGVYQNAATLTPTNDFGPSFSCPFVVLRAGFGTIIVTKVAPQDDATPFDFQAVGLEPNTFTLLDGESQTFEDLEPGTYAVSETLPDGWEQVSVTVSNDSPVDAIEVAGGETVTVTFTNQRSYHTCDRIIRRLRRAPHITQEDKRIFISQFQLILEPGVGNRSEPGLDPQVMLRVSHDAGHTWEPEQQMSAGELGHYRKRVIARQLGQARDLVFEVTVSDPVAWNLVEAFLDVEPGLF